MPIFLTPDDRAYVEAVDKAETYYRDHLEEITAGDAVHLQHLTGELGVEIPHTQLVANAATTTPDPVGDDSSRFHGYGTLSPDQRARLEVIHSPGIQDILLALYSQHTEVREITEQLDAATARRDQLIAMALDAGATQARVGTAIGLTQQSINNRAKRARQQQR